MPTKPAAVILTADDRRLFAALAYNPLETPQVLRLSETFERPFRDETRTRERLHALENAGWVRSFAERTTSRRYYKLTPDAFKELRGEDARVPSGSYFGPVSRLKEEHTRRLADVIVHTRVCAHRDGVQLADLRRENDLKLTLGDEDNWPDFSFRLMFAARSFNFLVELDLGSEPECSRTERETIEKKLRFHVRFQDHLLAQWRRRKQDGDAAPAPRYRLLFFTALPARARYILSLARALATDPNRKLCYAAAIDEYLSRPDALRAPVFLNHQGRWASLIDLHPDAAWRREPARLPKLEHHAFL